MGVDKRHAICLWQTITKSLVSMRGGSKKRLRACFEMPVTNLFVDIISQNKIFWLAKIPGTTFQQRVKRTEPVKILFIFLKRIINCQRTFTEPFTHCAKFCSFRRCEEAEVMECFKNRRKVAAMRTLYVPLSFASCQEFPEKACLRMWDFVFDSFKSDLPFGY